MGKFQYDFHTGVIQFILFFITVQSMVCSIFTVKQIDIP